MSSEPRLTVVIVGAGLMGTSLAMALVAAGHDVHLGDVDLDVASRGVGLAGVPLWVQGARPELDQRVDLALCAVPPAVTASVLIDLLELNNHLTVSDICSVKQGPLADVEASGADMSRLIGGHPVAGRETSGPEGAAADLFIDHSWVLCPGPTASSRSLQRMDRIVRECGALPIVMSAAEHDRVLAAVSHMPQVVASVVASALLELEGQDLRLAGPGVRDVTRIAASSADLWRQILSANAVAVRHILTKIAKDLTELAAAPLENFADQAEHIMVQGNAGRALLPDKGLRPVTWRWVHVALADAPGELGRLFLAVGTTGVNIEDLRVRHGDRGGSGWALLAVDPIRAGELANVLVNEGWRCELHEDGGDSDLFR